MAAGPTFVSGDISGRWNTIGSPYIVVGNCKVPAGKDLRLDPGIEVRIPSGLSITASGTITALGRLGNRILVHSTDDRSQFWGQIALQSTSGTNRIEFCDFRNATNALTHLAVNGGTVNTIIKGCSFSNCISSAISGESWGYGWNATHVNVAVNNSYFDATGDGCNIWLANNGYAPPGTASLSVRNSVFSNLKGAAVFLRARSDGGPSVATIANNTFVACGSGIATDDLWDATVRNSIFQSCRVAVRRNGTHSSIVAFNCFSGNQTNFFGYPVPPFGAICCQNPNGTASDALNNIFLNPKFAETVSYLLAPDSPCVDAGDPAAAFNDVRFPPSRGKAVNDIGAYGGPNVLAEDADMDGLLDTWEIQYFGNLETTDGAADPDEDGLINTKEALYGTNPTKADTDGDGFNDLAEVRAGTSPTDPNSLPSFALGIEVVAYDLELATAAGRRYQLQASEGMGLWDNLFDPIVGDGNVIRRRVEVGGIPYRFFKVKDITNP